MALGIEKRRIDPREAARLLATNDNPRGRHPIGRVDAYARVMTSGHWKLSIIMLDTHGRLVDGFGRLNAVIKTQTTQTFVVIAGWNEDDVDVIDANKARSPNAILRTVCEEKPGDVRALISGIVRRPLRHRVQLLNSDYPTLYELYQLAIDPVLPFITHKAGAPPICCVTGFCRAILFYNSSGKTQQILSGLSKLVELEFGPQDGALRTLAKFLRNGKPGASGNQSQDEFYLKTASAIEHWLNGVSPKRLVAGRDPYPVDVPF